MQVFSRTKSSWDMFGFWQTTFCMLDEGPEHKHLCFQDSLLLIYCRLHTNLYPCDFEMFSCSLGQTINGECGPKRVFSNFFPQCFCFTFCRVPQKKSSLAPESGQVPNISRPHRTGYREFALGGSQGGTCLNFVLGCANAVSETVPFLLQFCGNRHPFFCNFVVKNMLFS